MGSMKGFVSCVTHLNCDSSMLLFVCVTVAFGSDMQSMAEKAVGVPPPATSKALQLCGTQMNLARETWSCGQKAETKSLYVAISVKESVFPGEAKEAIDTGSGGTKPSLLSV